MHKKTQHGRRVKMTWYPIKLQLSALPSPCFSSYRPFPFPTSLALAPLCKHYSSAFRHHRRFDLTSLLPIAFMHPTGTRLLCIPPTPRRLLICCLLPCCCPAKPYVTPHTPGSFFLHCYPAKSSTTQAPPLVLLIQLY